MASTTFSGPVTSLNGFIGAITGNITGNVTGNVTGNITGDVFATIQSLSGAGAVNLTDMMTSLTTSPVMVALVQTASTLPVFLLGLPSGALADIVDRRRWFAFTQLWVSVIALVLAAMSV